MAMRVLVRVCMIGLLIATGSPRHRAIASEERSRTAGAPQSEVDDTYLFRRAREQFSALRGLGKGTPFKDLVLKTGREMDLKLPQASSQRQTLSAVYMKHADSVLILGRLFHYPERVGNEWGFDISSSAFVVSESGVIVTCCHVLEKENIDSLWVMCRTGSVHAVTGIIATNESMDIAVLQVDARGLAPLPLSGDEPTGSSVALVSNLSGNYYSMTEGIISRYFSVEADGRKAPRMAVTADAGWGSSGAPVFNGYGNVVGMVSDLRLVRRDLGEGRTGEVLHALTICVPARAILSALRGGQM